MKSDQIEKVRSSGGEWSAKSAFCVAEKMKASQLKAVSNFVGRGRTCLCGKTFQCFSGKIHNLRVSCECVSKNK